MKNRIWKAFGFFCFSVTMAMAVNGQAFAAPVSPEAQTSSAIVVQEENGETALYAAPEAEADVVGQVDSGEAYTVLEQVDEDWVKVFNGEVEGYLNAASLEKVEAAAAEAAAQAAEEAAQAVAVSRRQAVVDYGLQLVGGRYVYGGTNPNTGLDCSGFTSHVLRTAGGVNLSHSSGAQAREGRVVSAAEMQPGDLVFYSEGGRINHVALYIGNGKIVHASNPKNGILVSSWTYRNPVKIVNVLGD